MSIGRKEAVAVTVGVLLVTAAFVVPQLHLGIVTPLINSTPAQIKSFADTAPIFGWWNAHRWGTVPAILIGAAAVMWGTLDSPAAALAGVDAHNVGDIDAVGVRARDDRRLAARFRRPAHRPPRIPQSGTDDHRHPPRPSAPSPAASLISNRIRGSPMSPAIRPARC